MARPRAFNEDTALKAARDAFRRTGYAGTSLSDLSDAMGLGKGSLYNAFGTKEQLFDRAFAGYCAEATVGVDALFDEHAGLDAVLSYLHMITEDTIADQEHVGCMISKTTAELACSSESVVDRASGILHHIEDRITEALTRARRDGDLPAGAEPRELARLVLTISRGMEALGKAGYGAAALRDIEATAVRTLTA